MRYDRASQSHLVGEGFRNFHIGYAYIRRPLLAAFHSLLHIVGGQDYARVVALQTIVLALIPPMVYFLATSLHNRISGIIAATFMMLRVMNTDIMKQLMSDLPSQFMMVCLTLSTVAWAKRNEHVTVYSLISGCILGLTILVRPEAILLFLPLVAFSGVVQVPKHRFRIWLQNSILLALGTLLVLIPWLWRTWTITGNFTIDSPRLYQIIINQSSKLVGINNPQLPTAVVSDQETDGSPVTEAKTANKNKASKDQPIDLKQSAVDTLSHYLHSQVHTILILPTTVRSLDSFIAFQYHHDAERLWDDCCSYDNYLTRLPFWDEWYWRGNFPNQVIIPLILIVITLATGINIAWKRQKRTGLIPLILGISYLMIMAFLRTSGSRFILPADWISPLYFSIGLSHISTFIITSTTTLKFDENFGFPTLQKEATKHDANLLRTPKFYAVLIAVTLVGWSLPLFEVSIPQRYTENRTSEMLNGLWDSNQINEETRLILGEFLSQGGSAVTGRGLYPRFFQEESGEPGSNNVFGPRSYPRIGFYLTGPQSQMLVMPFESDQFSFPNKSDVVVFACVESTDKLESPWDVLAVAVFNKSSSLETLLLRSPLPSSLNCPLPENATSNPS